MEKTVSPLKSPLTRVGQVGRPFFCLSAHASSEKPYLRSNFIHINSDYDASQTPIPIDVINLGKEKGLIGLDAWPMYTHNQMVQLINQLPEQYCVDYQTRVSKN